MIIHYIFDDPILCLKFNLLHPPVQFPRESFFGELCFQMFFGFFFLIIEYWAFSHVCSDFSFNLLFFNAY